MNQFSIIFLTLLFSYAMAIDLSHSIQSQTTINNIIETFVAKGNIKDVFKVWHTLYRPSYEINTEEGINKYKVFKANLKAIEEHNSKNLSWQAGINNYSDMTTSELEKYFNIKEINAENYRKTMRGLLSLDDYDDSQDNNDPDPPRINDPNVSKSPVNWITKNPIRNQGGCGSCWAFSVSGAVEGNYSLNKSTKSPVLSTQQLVDCDYFPNNGGNWGCNGGWMRHANAHWQQKGIMNESDYPYIATLGTCKYNASMLSPVKVIGMETTTSHDTGMFSMLTRGPLSVCVNVQSAFYSYRSGLYNPACTLVCHHAVVLIGWAANATGDYWLVRNSWGTSWGEMGNFRVKDNGIANSFSCMIGHASYALRPTTN